MLPKKMPFLIAYWLIPGLSLGLLEWPTASAASGSAAAAVLAEHTEHTAGQSTKNNHNDNRRHPHRQNRRRDNNTQRRRLEPHESISEYIQSQQAQGIARPSFTIVGKKKVFEPQANEEQNPQQQQQMQETENLESEISNFGTEVIDSSEHGKDNKFSNYDTYGGGQYGEYLSPFPQINNDPNIDENNHVNAGLPSITDKEDNPKVFESTFETANGVNNGEAFNQFNRYEEYEIDVTVANPSVTDSTTYSVHGGPILPIKHSNIKFLVNDRLPNGRTSQLNTNNGDGQNGSTGGGWEGGLGGWSFSSTKFALLAVDESTGSVKGLAQKDGENFVNIMQLPRNQSSVEGGGENNGGDLIITETEEVDVPPSWECDMVNSHDNEETNGGGDGNGEGGNSSGQIVINNENSPFDANIDADIAEFNSLTDAQIAELETWFDGSSGWGEDSPSGRDRRMKSTDVTPEEHDISHESHHGMREQRHTHDPSNSHHQHHHRINTRNLRGSDISSGVDSMLVEFTSLGMMESILQKRRKLLNADSFSDRKLYPTDKFPQLYTYQVDLYIEIDDVVLANNNGDLDLAHQYINAVITAVSTIYEMEVDTHLHVAHIALTDIYKSAPSKSAVLQQMKATYGGETWHYQEGYGIDLHHAMLGQDFQGGIAYVGSLCDSSTGFGVSTGLMGSMSLGLKTFWDLYVVAHEIGHAFGAVHTHDNYVYDPPVDTCGLGSCSVDFPLAGSVTLMSYCHFCPGGLTNISPTFGGYWHEDDRQQINNWVNSPAIRGEISYEPRRVPQGMWKFVSSRTCANPNFEVPKLTCVQDSDCFDGKSCTDDKCDITTGECVNTQVESCCGNGVCEVGESECKADCGPFRLLTPECTTCTTPSGIMFDVTATTDIILKMLNFRHYTSYFNNITIYTARGSYMDKTEDPSAWTKLHSQRVFAREPTYVTVPFLSLPITAGSTQSFYIASTGKLLVGSIPGENAASDDNVEISSLGRGVGLQQFGYGQVGYSWDGHLIYNLEAPKLSSNSSSADTNSTDSPNQRQTESPDSGVPTTLPSSPPSLSPTKPPTASPTLKATPSAPSFGNETSLSTTTADVTASQVQSISWYMDWILLRCVQDCIGPYPCGGPRRDWNPAYDTVEGCCNILYNTFAEQDCSKGA